MGSPMTKVHLLKILNVTLVRRLASLHFHFNAVEYIYRLYSPCNSIVYRRKSVAFLVVPADACRSLLWCAAAARYVSQQAHASIWTRFTPLLCTVSININTV